MLLRHLCTSFYLCLWLPNLLMHILDALYHQVNQVWLLLFRFLVVLIRSFHQDFSSLFEGFELLMCVTIPIECWVFNCELYALGAGTGGVSPLLGGSLGGSPSIGVAIFKSTCLHMCITMQVIGLGQAVVQAILLLVHAKGLGLGMGMGMGMPYYPTKVSRYCQMQDTKKQ